jgi:hypothetical protein
MADNATADMFAEGVPDLNKLKDKDVSCDSCGVGINSSVVFQRSLDE